MRKPNEIKRLESAAIEAHKAGQSWGVFWADYGPAVAAAEMHNDRAYHKLRRRLLSLVVAGDTDGMDPVGDDAPWEVDDRQVSDTGTAAKCLLPRPHNLGRHTR